MLDHVSISHHSGLIFWSRSFTPAFSALSLSPSSPVNALVKEAFIEGKVRGQDDGFEKDGYSVRWTMENGMGLVFVVVFPALLPLTYIPALLNRMKQLFMSLFQPYIQSLVDLLHAGSMAITDASTTALRLLQSKIEDEKWEQIFNRCLRGCEGGPDSKTAKTPVTLQRQAQITAASETSTPGLSDGDPMSSLTAEEIAKNVQAMKGRMKAGRAKSGRGSPSPAASPSRKPSSNASAKLMRKWGDTPVSADDMAALDFSAAGGDASGGHGGTNGHTVPIDVEGLVSAQALGIRTRSGAYEVADWDFRRNKEDDLPTEEDILSRRIQASSVKRDEPGSLSVREKNTGWTSMFARLTGKKVLTKEDLRPVLVEMEKHLMGKNVAKDIAEKLCDGVESALVGKKLGGLSSVNSEVQDALSASLTRVLTPKTSTDVLLDIQRKRSSPAPVSSPDAPPDPYAMTFVGVNGVGKSTNLSKVCFWLLQNGLRVLIAACDTFRSGAVEQLRVHVRNLGALGEEMRIGIEGGAEKRNVELFEKGYGKDAAGIAKDAIAYAKENRFDVVLIDTAGRMQDNEPLMRALAKLVTVNNPDKIIFVGEALVGNEAVDQLTKFDRALKDFSSSGMGGTQRKRGIDGIILTKFDTIDDKVGAALSMTYVTGQPILFVGCGQTYTDLRHLRVNHIVQALLSS